MTSSSIVSRPHVKGPKYGNPNDSDTAIGPIINQKQLAARTSLPAGVCFDLPNALGGTLGPALKTYAPKVVSGFRCSLSRRWPATAMVFWKIDDVKQSTEGLDSEETGWENASSILTPLWNVEQCQLPQGMLDKLPKIETHEHDPIDAAERIIADMPNRPEIQYTGSKAFYSSITDRITLPPRELFTSAEELYGTALHQTVHSSGSQKRLAREGICEAAPLVRPSIPRRSL